MGGATSSMHDLQHRSLHSSIVRRSGPQAMLRAAENLDPSYVMAKRIHGETCLFAAAKAGALECLCMVQILKRAALSDAEFRAALDWRHPESGLTPLHVCTTGEAAAVLLLSGSRHIETRESVYGMTPLLWALNEVNADVVAVLRAWGASIELRDFSGRKAMDIAWWRSMPPTRRGKKCLAVIRGDADLNIFTGCQWLESEKIAKELSVAGITVHTLPSGLPHVDLSKTVIVDTIEDEGLQNEAALWDVDHSGSITREEFDDIMQRRKRRNLFIA